MENKDIIIIALIVIAIYLYYQQTQQKTLIIQPDNQELPELRNQVQHYQTLYQKRVARDVLLTSKEYPEMLEKKVGDLETALLNLAKQKIKGKKDAEKLVNELETN